jgi:LysM repeat protein
MHSFSPRRLGAITGPVLVGVVLLASCGGADSGATQSTIDLSAASTAFVVRPPATTVAPQDSAVPVAGAIVETEQDYVIQAGDYPYKLVEQFGVSLEDLVAYNEWASANEFPPPGVTIKIPPGGKAPGAPSAETASAADATGTADTTPAATIPDAGDNCDQGKYTIVANDVPSKVANKFDVTVEALNAANSGTSGYSSFYVGLEIVIPAKDPAAC